MLGYESEDHCSFKFLSTYELKSKIFGTFATHQDDLTKRFENIDWICTTADIWSTKQKSFMGVSTHFIDPGTLLRVHLF